MGDAATKEAEQYWGQLFDTNARPSELLNSLLNSIAEYISANASPKETRTLTPEKVNAYYRQVGGNYDPLFKFTPSADLSRIYAALGCRHFLQLGSNDYSLPYLPTLEPRGFVRWQTIQLLLDPAENVPYLQAAVRKLNLVNPSNGQSFPNVLPASAFPGKPDPAMTEWHNKATARLAEQAVAETQSTKPDRLAPHESRHRGSSRSPRRKSISPKSQRRPSRSPHRSSEKSSRVSDLGGRSSYNYAADARLAPPTSSSRRGSDVSPERRDRDPQKQESRKHHHSGPPEAYYKSKSSGDDRHRSSASSDSRLSRAHRHRQSSVTSTSSSSASSSGSSDSESIPNPSSLEPSPVMSRHSHHRSYDDETVRRRHLSPSRPELQTRDRSRSPNSNRYSHPSSSSRIVPVVPIPGQDRPLSAQFPGIPPEIARRGSGNIPTYVPAPPPLVSGRSDSAFMEIQPYERNQAQAFMDRQGGPPRGNYRGANVRFGDDQVLEYADRQNRSRRRSVDEREVRPPVVYRPVGGREVRGVDGRRYLALD